jgi:hypothetical protein
MGIEHLASNSPIARLSEKAPMVWSGGDRHKAEVAKTEKGAAINAAPRNHMKVKHRQPVWPQRASDSTWLFACNDYCNNDGVFLLPKTAPAV